MSPVKAVLFDRDGTLVEDVPNNADPDRVHPVEGAREALDLLRGHGIRTGVVTDQPGVAGGLLTDADVRRVNHRVDELLGPFDVFAVCPHGPDDGCHCRRPRTGQAPTASSSRTATPAPRRPSGPTMSPRTCSPPSARCWTDRRRAVSSPTNAPSRRRSRPTRSEGAVLSFCWYSASAGAQLPHHRHISRNAANIVRGHIAANAQITPGSDVTIPATSSPADTATRTATVQTRGR